MLQKKKLSALALSAALLTLLSMPSQATVVTSIKPLGFIAAAIADGVTPVQILLPDGVSEHAYSLKPSDIKRLQSADLVVWTGPEMEAFMPKVVAQLAAQKSIEIAALPGVKPLLLKGAEEDEHDEEGDGHGGHGHHHGEYNMHLWMSPEIAKQAAVAIHAKLSELMPENRDKLNANLQHFEVTLAAADKKISAELAPVKGKGYFVFHDAYTYFEKHFGLTPAGHFTVNPEIQPGAQRLHKIRTELVEQKAVCVFAEPQFRPAVIEAVAKGTQVRQGVLDPLGTNITPDKDSYVTFLSQLSSQYSSCLKGA
ncbi:MAG: High-affinity zinc uptake system protein ZnuA [Candidatus Erwinia impunctatus]|nr:High-affinity zinc uptake system protein ZnuA [Culicoides impunctatus]